MRTADYPVGSPVWVHAMGNYYAGTVVVRTPARVQIEYTSGSGRRRLKWVSAGAESPPFTIVPRVEGIPAPRGNRQLNADARHQRRISR